MFITRLKNQINNNLTLMYTDLGMFSSHHRTSIRGSILVELLVLLTVCHAFSNFMYPCPIHHLLLSNLLAPRLLVRTPALLDSLMVFFLQTTKYYTNLFFPVFHLALILY